jgi:hypothetical protein
MLASFLLSHPLSWLKVTFQKRKINKENKKEILRTRAEEKVFCGNFATGLPDDKFSN